MQPLLLFFIFFMAGIFTNIIARFLLLPLKIKKNKITVFCFDFILTTILCFVLQLLTTLLNFGIFRAYFVVSYIFAIIISNTLIIKPLEKLLLMFYNGIIKGWRKKYAKKL